MDADLKKQVGEVVDVGASNIAAEPFTLAQAGWSYGG